MNNNVNVVDTIIGLLVFAALLVCLFFLLKFCIIRLLRFFKRLKRSSTANDRPPEKPPVVVDNNDNSMASPEPPSPPAEYASKVKSISNPNQEKTMNEENSNPKDHEVTLEPIRLVIQPEEIYPKSEEFLPLMNKIEQARQEIAKQVFGMGNMIDQCFIALLSGGHVLCEGLPGLAKTTLAKAFAKVVSCSFKRCQFSPDLLPSDLLGDRIFNQKSGDFDFKAGPVFTQILLADEINRAPAKTQAALLEVMQESQVTVFGERHLIGAVEGMDASTQSNRVFFTIATQNPIEQEGTYRLPEAQLDRFMFRLFFHWPVRKAELAILELENGLVPPPIELCFTAKEIVQWREKIARDVQASADIKEQIVDLMRMTREHKDILVGAGPRASQVLLRGAKVRAAMDGRNAVREADVQAVAFDALNHRILLKPDVVFDHPEANPLDLLKTMLDNALTTLRKHA